MKQQQNLLSRRQTMCLPNKFRFLQISMLLAMCALCSGFTVPYRATSSRSELLSATSPSLSLLYAHKQQQPQKNEKSSVSKLQPSPLHLVLPLAFAVWLLPTPAHATYSAYTHRADDWSNRLEQHQVQFSSARSLRQQLREIVPQNNNGNLLFCPNGAPSNVSPLMENKCDDTRQALPSIFGRTDDVVGNSVPGFKGGQYASAFSSSRSEADELGGFPAYIPTSYSSKGK